MSTVEAKAERTPKAGETWTLRALGREIAILDYLPEHQVVVYWIAGEHEPKAARLDRFLAICDPPKPPRPPLPEPRYGVLWRDGTASHNLYTDPQEAEAYAASHPFWSFHVIRWVPECVDGDQ